MRLLKNVYKLQKDKTPSFLLKLGGDLLKILDCRGKIGKM
jgi:hypothetical protein